MTNDEIYLVVGGEAGYWRKKDEQIRSATLTTDMGGLIEVETIREGSRAIRLRISKTYDFDREKTKEIVLTQGERKELACILHPDILELPRDREELEVWLANSYNRGYLDRTKEEQNVNKE